MFDSIFGITSNLQDQTINWDVRLLEEHGIDRYPIGKDGLLSLRCATRNNVKQKPELNIESTVPMKLKLSWGGGSNTFDIKPGTNKL